MPFREHDGVDAICPRRTEDTGGVCAAPPAAVAEAALREDPQALAHAARVATMGQLAGSLAHELNQPLGAILSNAEAARFFLDQDPPDTDELREILADIAADARRAGKVIRNVRAQVRNGAPELRTVDLQDVLAGAEQLLHGDAIARQTTLVLEPARDLPSVRGDAVQLQQVVLNLVLNAFDAMAAVTHRRRAVVRTVRRGPSEVEVEVEDTGPGIAVEPVSRIFDPFFTTKHDGRSLGLGLAIARSIVEAHRGQVFARNNPGGGASVGFVLPAGAVTLP